MAISFYIGYIIPILAPLIVLYNMLYVPIFQGYFPTVFFIGLFSMAMLMSMTQLLMRRSKLWMYGIVYQAYYIAVLVWQMPLAWVTFWKTTWGTRMTANDIRAKWRGKRGRRQPNRPVVNTYAEDV